ncbi:hypothetical protein CYMTET_44083, partial [Cymbomonas tetramitiformis]
MDAEQILHVIVNAQNAASLQERQMAEQIFEQMKISDPRSAATTATALAEINRPLEARIFGFGMLHHLVKNRWQEFSADEHVHLARLAADRLKEVGNAGNDCWAIKCKASALFAEVLRQEGVSSWGLLLPEVLSLASIGPSQAELVAMVLRWVPEDVTVHNEDILGLQMQALLKGLLAALPEILPFLYKMLDQHFGAAVTAAQAGSTQAARAHAAAVDATLSAVQAYADWAPVPMFAQHGLLDACGHLLASTDFQLQACSFLRQ